ncbi:sugar-phosphatase [Listeria fleischmannii]|uniref:sugar-phosphatase n=1 Tax=Listeria fleischmannii TaxID=1069827 RepID=UPI00162A0AAC|nr:sugar-phosphatase [Listeria fleischmannii]MBC1419990.1 sugar-phosphatase [Listeria fleischmannii]
MIKLVAIDIDGTLLNDDHEITPGVRDAIVRLREKNVKVVLCTGRPLSGIEKSLTELDLFHDEDMAITMNGAITLSTKTRETIVETTLAKSDLQKVFTFCDSLGAHVTYFDASNMYVPHKEISILTCQDSLLLQTPLYYKPVEEVANSMRIPKIMLLDYPEKIVEVMEKLPDQLKEAYYIVRSVPYNLEFLHKNVSKGTALAMLSEKLQLTADEVLCLGDAENDLSMMEFAGTAVAMGNATDKVKNLATFVTKTNNEDGVAFALQQFI